MSATKSGRLPLIGQRFGASERLAANDHLKSHTRLQRNYGTANGLGQLIRRPRRGAAGGRVAKSMQLVSFLHSPGTPRQAPQPALYLAVPL